MTGVLIKTGHLDTDMHTGRAPRKDWGDPSPKRGNAEDCQQTPRSWRMGMKSPLGETHPDNRWAVDFGLQNWGRIRVCC